MTDKKSCFSVSIFTVSLGIFFALFSFLFNLLSFCLTGNGGLLKPWANLIILIISLLPSILTGLKLSNNKLKSINALICIFPLSVLIISFFTLNLLPFINSNLKNLWSIFSIITVNLAYILFFLVLTLLESKSFLLKSVLSLIIFGASYFVITLAIGNLGQGGNILVIISVFLIIYSVITAVAYIVSRILKAKQNQAKKYTRQF
ncbi:MAG: hypothetical protein IJ400_01610 [Clostridia bacterium]|nr:hypothetical protein [Clostridia bacterium]